MIGAATNEYGEYATKTIYPEDKNVFNALNQTKYENVKVVIIGQDPYINEGQAHGLCFSVEKVVPPPSLVNIFKELNSELGCYIPNNGNLTKWAKQGVLDDVIDSPNSTNEYGAVYYRTVMNNIAKVQENDFVAD